MKIYESMNLTDIFCLLISWIQNREVNNVSNIIIIEKANAKSSVGQHWPPTNANVGSGAMEE
jgi:hypothetical protein